MDLFNALFQGDPEALQSFVSKAAQADISEWCLKVAIVWLVMGRRVKDALRDLQKKTEAGIVAARQEFTDHFSKIEKGLTSVATQMQNLSENVARDLTQHREMIEGNSKRLVIVEGGLNEVKAEVAQIKPTKQ